MIYMAIKMIATDLDGTLLNSNKKAPEEFYEWVVRHPEIRTVIASGRQYQTIRAMFGQLGDKITYCADNGGFIFHEGKMLYSNPLKEEDLTNALRYMGHIPGVTLVLSGAKSAYVESPDPKVLDSIRMYFTALEVVDNLSQVIGEDIIVKVSLYEENGDAETMVNFLPNLGSHIENVLSEKHWVDIQNKTTSKGTAMRFLQDYYSIPREKCMAFGDYLNDYTMMKACHYSFAMANAHPKLKEIANYQTTTNDYMGVMNMVSVMTE